jgi:hypothetical protein
MVSNVDVVARGLGLVKLRAGEMSGFEEEAGKTGFGLSDVEWEWVSNMWMSRGFSDAKLQFTLREREILRHRVSTVLAFHSK